MNISFECSDKVNGLMTVTIEKEDYEKEVEKKLKDYRKRANVPGFRQGNAPMGIIKRQMGEAVKADEVNNVLGKAVTDYLRDNKIAMLGEPMTNDEKQGKMDFKADDTFTFYIDIAVAPEVNAELTDKDTIDYYNITVEDKTVDEQVEMFRSRAGHYDKVEAFDASQNDMLKGDLRELDAEGNTKEDGIVVEGAVLMPQYIKVDEQKNLFNDAKLGSIITFNPRKAYPENDAEVASLLKIKKEEVAEKTGDFTYQVTEISRYTKADVNQELFDSVFGKDVVKDEKTFREKIAEGIKSQLVNDSDYMFIADVRKYLEGKVGELTYPDALLKKFMLKNNKDKGEKFVDDNYAASIKELTWHLIKEKLVEANSIKINDDDVKAVAHEVVRIQFAQYGMNNVPDEYVEKYAADMMKDKKQVDNLVDRAIDVKLTEALKKVVKLNEKSVTLDEFNKIAKEKNA